MKIFQNTLERDFKLLGSGAYTRQRSGLWLRPADTDSGIFFNLNGCTLNASIDNAEYGGPERKTTILKNSYNIICPEHLLAALFLAGVTNAEIGVYDRDSNGNNDHKDIDTDNNKNKDYELPMFNGSPYQFYESLLSANIVPNLDEDYQPKRVEQAYLIKEPIEVVHDKRSITAVPIEGYSPKDFFRVYTEIYYKNPAIGNQSVELNISDLDIESLDCLLNSRTFCFEDDLMELEKQEPGIIDMAKRQLMVLDRFGNPSKKMGGFIYHDEAVLHKTVDLLGDLKLLGYPIIGEIRASKPGHEINLDFAKTIQRESQKEHGKAELIYIDQ